MEDDIPTEIIEEMEDKASDDIKIKGWLKPSKDELYILLLKGDNKSDLYKVISIDTDEKNLIMNDSKDKSHTFELDEDKLILSSKKFNYTILDIERVISFNLKLLNEDDSQLKKVLTSDIIKGLNISLDEIKEKDIIYTDIELREELLSSLVNIYNAYDKLNLISKLNEYINDIFKLLKRDISFIVDKEIPVWLIPIVDNPIKVYTDIVNSDGDEINESIHIIQELSELSNNNSSTNHTQISRSMLDILRPVNPSLSDIGYTTSVVRKYVRNCLLESSCIGYNGNYIYDKRLNKLPYISNSEIIDNSDKLNICGLLYIPDSHLIQSLNVMDNRDTSLSYKILLQKIIEKKYYNIINLRKQTILLNYFNDIDELDLDNIISYLFTERITKEKFYEEIKKISPSIEDIIKSINPDIRSKLLNYNDIQLILLKYNLDISKLSKESKKTINSLVKENCTNYIKHIETIPKIILNYIKKELTIEYRITKLKEIIFSMNSIAIRNEYLLLFIDKFTRPPIKNEDKNSLYNIYTNEKILCKHYLFSSSYHKDKEIHSTMISIYGKPSEDGIIYCKHCGEYLCDEDYSSFDGFIGEEAIQLREVMKQDTNILDGYNEELILLVKLITSSFGINIKDNDIDFILSVYSSLNQDKILSIRYSLPNITSIHPLIDDIKKKYKKDKDKKEKIKTEMKKLQIYFKETNKLLSLVSLSILIIQLTIPTYKNKSNFMFNLLEFKDKNFQNISFKNSVIDYCLLKLDKLSKVETGEIWSNYNQLSSEEKVYDLNTIKNQILNLVKDFITPQYNSIQNKVIDYINFTNGVNSTYIKDEWPIYKPLRKNKDISKVDNLIQSKHDIYSPYYLLNYNNYPIENISLIQSLSESSEKYIYENLNIPISEIMVNRSFLLIFKLALSNYGIYKGKSKSIYLHIDRFLDTIKKRDTIESIFTKHGYTKKNHISYKVLRNKIIPDIISHYQTIIRKLSF